MLIESTRVPACEQIAERDPPVELVKTAVLKNIKDFFASILIGRFVFYVLLTLGKKKRDDTEKRDDAEKTSTDPPADAAQTLAEKDSTVKSETPVAKHEKIGWSNLRFTGPRGAIAISLFEFMLFSRQRAYELSP